MDGIDDEKLEFTKDLVFTRRGSLKRYVEKFPKAQFHEGKRPWQLGKFDIALPTACENELNGEDAKALVKNGVKMVAEGANMPSTPEAVEVFLKNKVMFAPGKASNAGGVATSGLEMSQNAQHLYWTREEVDARLQQIMKGIHESCVKYGKDGDYVNYVNGANVAGFIKVADAMIAQGVV
jgi:glutamate dehydrogenase (NADP+)